MMLVLSRKVGEKIVIGKGENQVEVQVVDIDRGKVRLGFCASQDIKIFRSELLERGEEEVNRHA